jgi:hypothetical protein
MTLTLETELFEFVPAAAGTMLLRIEARWHSETREPLPIPTLIIDDGRRSQRLPPLPGPDTFTPRAGPEPELWRATYAAPEQATQGSRVAFALDLGSGRIVDLPPLSPRGKGVRYSRSLHAELAHERSLRADAERLADDRRRALRDAETALDRERAERATATMRADAADSELARVAAELEAANERHRADITQHARDQETASNALIIAQAHTRELEEALAAARRRTLEVESEAATAEQEAREAAEHERERQATALATQRSLAEEATRARVAAEAKSREHAARVIDLEVARDELRARLEKEREALRNARAAEAGESALEQRREFRELQRQAIDAERRAEDAERRLEAVSASNQALQDSLAQASVVETARARSAAAQEASPQAQMSQRPAAEYEAQLAEAQQQIRNLTEELVQAAHLRAELQDQLAVASAATAAAHQETQLAIDERAELERTISASWDTHNPVEQAVGYVMAESAAEGYAAQDPTAAPQFQDTAHWDELDIALTRPTAPLSRRRERAQSSPQRHSSRRAAFLLTTAAVLVLLLLLRAAGVLAIAPALLFMTS